MKILQVREDYIPPARDSQGAERVIESLSRGLRTLGHEVLFMTSEPSADFDFEVVDDVPSDCDIIHFHGWDPKLDPDRFKATGLPVVYTIHGGGMEQDPAWLKSVRENSNKIIYVSKFIQDLHGGLGHVWTCSNPEDFIFREKKDDYFLWLAGTDWGESKGLFSTINLAKTLKFNLLIAGSGKNQSNINLIKSYCDDRIKYVGSVNGKEKAEVIAGAKALFLLTQLPDACPTVMSESLLSGTPIIGTRHGSLPEVLNDDIAVLCDNTGPAVASAVVKIRNGVINPHKCREYGLKHLSHITSAEKNLRFYKNMLRFGTIVPD